MCIREWSLRHLSNSFTAKRLLTAQMRPSVAEVGRNMPLNWIGAFKRALVYFLWLIVWGIIGILMMAIGAYVATVPLTNLFAGKTPAVGTELITGIVLLILGYIITMLGAVATLIRLVYQLSFEATQEAMTKESPLGLLLVLRCPWRRPSLRQLPCSRLFNNLHLKLHDNQWLRPHHQHNRSTVPSVEEP